MLHICVGTTSTSGDSSRKSRNPVIPVHLPPSAYTYICPFVCFVVRWLHLATETHLKLLCVCFVLFCFVLFCFVLFCSVLFCSVCVFVCCLLCRVVSCRVSRNTTHATKASRRKKTAWMRGFGDLSLSLPPSLPTLLPSSLPGTCFVRSFD
jgi:hypothetical protein